MAESSLNLPAGLISDLCSLANSLGFGEKVDLHSSWPGSALWTEGLAGGLRLEQKLLLQENLGKQDV